MAFVSGLMGPYMRPIPINASAGMLLSLAVALVVTLLGLAAARAATEARSFDAILADLDLPDGNGIDVCRALRQSNDPRLRRLPRPD